MTLDDIKLIMWLCFWIIIVSSVVVGVSVGCAFYYNRAFIFLSMSGCIIIIFAMHISGICQKWLIKAARATEEV